MSPANADARDPQTMTTWCQQAAAGDADALAQLLWAHHARLLGFARRKIGVDWQGKIEPEDLLQEAYIDIFQAIRDFTCSDGEAFYHWATRIIDHRFIDQVRHWRRRKRDAAREVHAAHGGADAAGTSTAGTQALLARCRPDLVTPSVALRQQDAAAALMSGIAQLPEDYRVVVQRLYLRQEPLAAVAADLGRSEDAVRRLAGRALERLTSYLGRASRYLSSHA